MKRIRVETTTLSNRLTPAAKRRIDQRRKEKGLEGIPCINYVYVRNVEEHRGCAPVIEEDVLNTDEVTTSSTSIEAWICEGCVLAWQDYVGYEGDDVDQKLYGVEDVPAVTSVMPAPPSCISCPLQCDATEERQEEMQPSPAPSAASAVLKRLIGLTAVLSER